jgi:hypothetical protein
MGDIYGGVSLHCSRLPPSYCDVYGGYTPLIRWVLIRMI